MMFCQTLIALAIYSVFLYFSLLLIIVAGTHVGKAQTLLDGEATMYAALAAVMVVLPDVLYATPSSEPKAHAGHLPTPRQRKKVKKLMEELGEIYMCHTYWMSENSFWILLELLSDTLQWCRPAAFQVLLPLCCILSLVCLFPRNCTTSSSSQPLLFV